MRSFSKLTLAMLILLSSKLTILNSATIDKILVSNFGDDADSYSPQWGLNTPATPNRYVLSDGSEWRSGAGGYQWGMTRPDSVTTDGGVIRYTLAPTNTSGIAEKFTDYSWGDHSAQGELDYASPLVLVANAGSKTATLNGYLLLVSNDETWYGEPRFNYFNAGIGAIAPFSMVYTLQSGTWTPDIFTTQFSYFADGEIDFVNGAATPEPSSCLLLTLSLPLFLLRRRLVTKTLLRGRAPFPVFLKQ